MPTPCRHPAGRSCIDLQYSSLRRTNRRPNQPYCGAVAAQLPRWLTRDRGADAALAIGFTAAAAVEELLRGAAPSPLLLMLSGLACRRSRPLLTVTLITLSRALGWFAGALLPAGARGSSAAAVPILALMLASYSLGAHAGRRQLALGAALPVWLVTVIGLVRPDGYSLSSTLPFFAVFVVAAPTVTGRLVRGRTQLVARLEQRQRELREERRHREEAALALERLQIATDLNRALVVGIEGMIALTDDARNPSTPNRAQSVAMIERTARRLLAETRRVVVTLSDGEPVSSASQASPAHAVDDHHEPSLAGEAALPWTAILAAAMCMGLLLDIDASSHLRVPRLVALLACLIIPAPIALAYVRPLVMISVVWSVSALFSLFILPLPVESFSAIALALVPAFVVAAFGGTRSAVLGLAIACIGALAVFGSAQQAGALALLALAWIAGRVFRDRSQLVRELERTNTLLADERDTAVRQAVLVERARLARELHDAVGHTLTVIALQAGAARRLWRTDTQKAEAALGTIARAAQDGLGELSLGLATTQVSGSPPPQSPGLAAIYELVEGTRTAGASVELIVETAVDELAPETRAVAYRLVQEALTNALRHAPGAPVTVTVRRSGGGLEISVSNPAGANAVPPRLQPGQGLRGMEQRVAGCGGQVRWSRSGGVFRVHGWLPPVPIAGP